MCSLLQSFSGVQSSSVLFIKSNITTAGASKGFTETKGREWTNRLKKNTSSVLRPFIRVRTNREEEGETQEEDRIVTGHTLHSQLVHHIS